MSTTQYQIYTGFWTNWSYGSVRGSTLTLSAEHSAFLVAFIALWVKFAGGQLWAVITFLASISRSTAEPRDGLYHQQQAILRNTSQPTTVLWDMLKLSWFWRGKATNVRTRTFTFAFSSLAYIAAFAVAGIFSSKIASNNSEVLLVPIQTCGIWPYPWSDVPNPDIPSWQDWSIQRLSYWSNFFALMRESHTYVAQCYNSSIDEPTEACLPHGKNRISWTTNTMVKCPFEDMCVADAIQFDTGFLSSQNHFGINVKDDIEYRRVMTCAPIKTDGYVTDYVSELDLSENADQVVLEGDTWLKYTYGGSYYFNDNTTYAYSNFSWGSPFAVSAGIDIYQVEYVNIPPSLFMKQKTNLRQC